MNKTEALLIIDVQHDFLEGGALEVAGSLSVLEPIANLSKRFDVRIATQDWHPAGHASFASTHPGKQPFEQVLWKGQIETLWPDHCIQHSVGAQLHPVIDALIPTTVIQKGTHTEVDSYSAFFDNHRLAQTELHGWLQAKGITGLHVCGLATDYCVLFTVLDALELGYQAHVYHQAISAVNLLPTDGPKAIEKMKAAGALVVTN